MINKINKIKKLGLVFINYTWDIALPAFKRVNLIYGWNGSGKTTLSRLFDAIGGNPIKDLEYEIEDDQGNKFKNSDTFTKKIRVFNQDYVQNNIKILESRTNSISIFLGKENKDLVEKIENDKKILTGDPTDPTNPGKIALLDKYKKDKSRVSTAKDSQFTEIARTIGAAIGGNALRDYRKPQAEKDFFTLTAKSELPNEAIEKYLLIIKQDFLPSIEILSLKKVKLEDAGAELDISSHLTAIKIEAGEIFSKTIESEIISRLSDNADISNWVEKGIHLHNKHSSDVCEYCLQKLPPLRIEQLSRYFNEADQKLKSSIDVLLEKLRKLYPIIQSIKTPDRARFYKDLQPQIDISESSFELEKTEILEGIKVLANELKVKKNKTMEALTSKTKIDPTIFYAEIGKINDIISTHNKTTSNLDTSKKEAVQNLKTHYLSTIFDSIQKHNTEISKLDANINLLEPGIATIRKQIADDMAKVSSQHKACEDINKKLATFLGHQELTFSPVIKKEAEKSGQEREFVTGYSIMRGNSPAIHLSEGEKTAIAFVYFVVHLGDHNFNTRDGIIVIDDPISSLDSNSLYQAFSFLKNAVKDASQAFILTHNFDFLKLLLNWRHHAKRDTGYYMIKNHFPGNARCARIDKMDKELCEYESEYHYLFKLLKHLRDEQDNTIAKAYPVPNIARKVWETFLMFRVPNGNSTYQKMTELKNEGHDEQKLDAIYKFTNDHSHVTGAGFNLALVPETKKVITELFEMMQKISPKHFKIIDTTTN